MKTPKQRINGCTMTKDGIKLYCRWQTGFKSHCQRLVKQYVWGVGATQCAWSGRAEVVMDKKDFLINID